MSFQSAVQVRRECSAIIIDDHGKEHAIKGAFDYGSHDPFAITLTVSTSRRSVPWTFARELLEEARYAPAGSGAVHLWPTLSTDGRAMVAIELTNADTVALILVPSRDVAEFLDVSHLIVPKGEESLGSDLDAALASLLADRS